MLRLFACCLAVAFVLPLQSQDASLPYPDRHRAVPPEEVRLPNGKLQQEEILKSDHERSLEDARQLVVLSQSLQKDLEQSGAQVLTLTGVRKTEEIEKLAKRIRGRLRRS